MKRKNKIISTIVIIVIFILVAVNIFISFYAPGIIRRSVLPAAKQSLGVDVAIDEVSVNALAGFVRLSGAQISNPPGFQEPSVLSLDSFELDIGVSSLFKGVVQVSKAQVKDLVITVERNADGDINTLIIGNNARQASRPAIAQTTPAPESKPETQKEAVKLPPIPFILKDMRMNAVLKYVDHKTPNAPSNLVLELSMTANDIATVALPDNRWGSCLITGAMKNNTNSCTVNVNSRIAPITSPDKNNFDITGTISNINTRELAELVSQMEVKSDSMDIILNIICRDNVYQNESTITFCLNNPQLTGSLEARAKTMNVTMPAKLAIPVTLGGTVDNPDFRIHEALINAVLELLTNNFDATIKSLAPEKANEPTIKEGIKKLRDAFKSRVNGQ